MQTKKQAVQPKQVKQTQQTKQAPRPKQVKEAAAKRAPKSSIARLSVLLSRQTKADLLALAKKRDTAVSVLVSRLVQQEIDQSREQPERGALKPDTTLVITGMGPQTYQSPQWVSQGKAAPEPQAVGRVARFLNRFFG